MSVQDQLAPYLNQFDTLLRNNENASLEITCNNGNVVVNFKHNLDKTKTTEHLRNLNKFVKTSQLNRLQKRAISRAEEARKGLQEQQKIEKNAKQELAIHERQAEKATLEAEHARQEAAKALQVQDNDKTKARQAKTELSRLLIEIKDQQGQQQLPDAKEQCHVEITEDTESAVKQQTPHIKCPSCQKRFKTEHSLAEHIGPPIVEGVEPGDVSNVKCQLCDHYEEFCSSMVDHVQKKHKKTHSIISKLKVHFCSGLPFNNVNCNEYCK